MDQNSLTQVENQIKAHLSHHFSIKLGLITELDGDLNQCEEEIADSMSVSRRREFRAGRVAAKQALGSITGDNKVILRAEGGYPIFPEGFVGSISHKGPCVGALVSSTDYCVGLGFDIEEEESLSERVWSTFASIEEVAVSDQLGVEVGVYANMLFCVKEALYKSLSPLLKEDTPELSSQVIILEKQNNQYITKFVGEQYHCECGVLRIGGGIFSWAVAKK